MIKKEKSGNKAASKKQKNPGNGLKAKEAAEKPMRQMEDAKRKG